MAILESNTDLDVKGRVLATTVPNSTGSIVTWNASTKVFGLRTNAQIIADLGLQRSLTAGSHINITSNSISAILTDGVWLEDSSGNRRIHVGSVSSTNDFLFRSRHTGFAEFKWQDAAGTSFMELNGTTFRVQGLGGTGSSLINADSSGSLFRTGIDPNNIALQNGTYPNMTVGQATNATTATRLATARTINGTSFNGSANIVTSYWGTARNITIGSTTKSVNGSGNYSWSLAEIGINTGDFVDLVSNQTIEGSKRFADLGLRRSGVNTSTSSGWHRIAKVTGRGYFEVGIHFSGGSFTPSSFILKGFLSWTATSTQNDIQLDALGMGSYVRGARMVQDGDIYLEVDFSIAPSSQVQQTVSYLKGGTASVELIPMIPVSTITGTLWAESLPGWDNRSTDFTLVRAENFKTVNYGTAQDWHTAFSWGNHTGLYALVGRSIVAGNGLSGGGTLAANRTITLGTPGAITLSSTNSVTTSSHTHALDAATTTAINNGNTAHGWGDFRDYGLGITSTTTATTLTSTTIDDPNLPNGLYHIASAQNTSFSGSADVLVMRSGATGYTTQKMQVINSGDKVKMYLRHYRVSASTWSSWREVITDENLDSQATSLGFIKSSDLPATPNLQQVLNAGNEASNTHIYLKGSGGGFGTYFSEYTRPSSGGWARNGFTFRVYAPDGTTEEKRVSIGATGGYVFIGPTHNTGTSIRWYDGDNEGVLRVNARRIPLSVNGTFADVNGDIDITLPTVNNGQLTLSTGTGLSGSATFTANQAGSSTFSVAVASTHKLPTTAEWTAALANTITRLRGTASGTYTSGDLTLLAGANTTITQSGANITIASTNTNTTYTAGTGLSLSGTTFGQAITTSGTGTFVTGITQTTNGFQINLGTPPNTNTTYTGSNGINVTGTVISPTYGTAANTIAQGNDSRINNGQTAFGWGNHINMYVGGINNPLADPLTYSGAHSALPLGSYTAILSTSATGFPSQATGGIFSFGRTATNISSRIFGSRSNVDGLWYSNGDPAIADIYQVASREWVNSQNFSTQTLTAGTNISIVGNVISATNTNTTYTAGSGLTLSGTAFSLPVTVSGTGTYVQSVTQTTNGITVTLGTPPNTNTTYSNMAIAELNAGTVTTARTISASVLNQWLNGKGFSTQTLTAGTNITISGNTISATNTNTTYTAGAGLSLTGTTFANTAPNATHTGDVTGSTALTIANSAVTHAKYQNIATQRILGRGAAGTGNVQELTLGANLSLSTAGVLSATNTNTTYTAGTGISLSGTTFGQTITTSGSGTFVSSITQTANGFQVNLSTPAGGGPSGIQSIYTDNSAFSGPANDPEITFNFHEYWGFPQAFAEEYQPGNATAKATRGQLDFFASYDSVQTLIESGEADVSLNGYHITNVMLTSAGGDVYLPDGIYAGDQVNITTVPNQQINIYANNLITTGGNEVWTFANLIWDCEQVAWVLVAYGTP